MTGAAPSPSARAAHIFRGLLLTLTALLAAGVLLGWQLAARSFPVWADENVHLYVAGRVSEGAVLYRDVDSARPPLVIWPVAGLIALGLPPLLAARSLVSLLYLGTAAAMFAGARRLFGLRPAALAALLYLLSPEITQRAPYTGIQLVSLGSLGCLLLALLGRPLASGAVFGLALASGQHSLLVGLSAAGVVIVRRPRDGLHFGAGLLAVFAALFGLARLLGAEHLWENLVARHLYHLAGSEPSARLSLLLWPWMAEHVPLFALAGAALALRGRLTPVRWIALAVALQFLALLAMSEAKFLYIIPVFPLLCLLAGVGADALVNRVVSAPARGGLALGLLLVTAGGWWWAHARREAVDARQYSFVPHRRSLQMSRLQKLDIATVVARDVSASVPADARLFGQPTITAAVATAAHRRIAADLADLHERWIRDGRLTFSQVIDRIEGDRVGAVITPRWTLVRDPTFSGYLRRCYQPPRIYPRPAQADGGGIPDILLFLRRPLPRPCS